MGRYRIDQTTNARAGMTLIEMFVVMAIIVMLVFTVIPRVQAAGRRGKEATLQEQLHAMRNGIQQFAMDCGDYPLTLDQLVSHPSSPRGGNGVKLDVVSWRGPYLTGPEPGLPKDPFTASTKTWVYQPETGEVHSGSKLTSSMRDPYSSW